MNRPSSSFGDSAVCRKCGRSVSQVSISTCPDCGGSVVPRQQARVRLLSLPDLRYSRAHMLLVFLSGLDIILTWTILAMEGQELNPLAAAVIDHIGLPGMVAFKFCLVAFVMIMSEVIGRKRPKVGRKVGTWAIGLSAIPVVLAVAQLVV